MLPWWLLDGLVGPIVAATAGGQGRLLRLRREEMREADNYLTAFPATYRSSLDSSPHAQLLGSVLSVALTAEMLVREVRVVCNV